MKSQGMLSTKEIMKIRIATIIPNPKKPFPIPFVSSFFEEILAKCMPQYPTPIISAQTAQTSSCSIVPSFDGDISLRAETLSRTIAVRDVGKGLELVSELAREKG